MKAVRFGVVGVGGMGGNHARGIVRGGGRTCRLVAVADKAPEIAERVGQELDVAYFDSAQAMYESGLCEAVLVATPHYWHAPLTIRAARAGLHVLCEKPMAAAVGDARAMIRECAKRKVALGVMLQQRLRGVMRKARQLVVSGRIGEVFRAQLICSNWFRTQRYYDHGAWRGTWSGEGGGVLTNQAPHSLDLFQWLGGMPRRVVAVMGTRAHKIEVEDTANIIFEYDKGKTGYIYATTAEEPGYEQLWLAGDKGTLVVEGNRIRLGRLKVPVRRHIMSSPSSFDGSAEQAITWRDVPHPAKDGGHIGVTQAFARHIRTGSPPVATGVEGLCELELANAAYLSGYRNKRVDLPVSAAEMDRLLSNLERTHGIRRGGPMRREAARDMRKLLPGRKR